MKYLDPPIDSMLIGPHTSVCISSSGFVATRELFLGNGERLCLPMMHPSHVSVGGFFESRPPSPLTMFFRFNMSKFPYERCPYLWCHRSRETLLLQKPSAALKKHSSRSQLFNRHNFPCRRPKRKVLPFIVNVQVFPSNVTLQPLSVMSVMDNSFSCNFGTYRTFLIVTGTNSFPSNSLI